MSFPARSVCIGRQPDDRTERSTPMGRLVLYMSMSLDGFIAGPGDTNDNPFGTDGQRLHEWLGDGGEDVSGYRPGDEAGQTLFDELMSTGAVITGRRTGDYVGYWGGDHHDGVPIFVPTHQAPAGTPPGGVNFVTGGIESCVEDRKSTRLNSRSQFHLVCRLLLE